MPIELSKQDIIAYLQRFMNNNKARGMAAEMALKNDLSLSGLPAEQKLLSGAWIISPRDKYYVRYCSFVMPALYATKQELDEAVHNLEQDRNWQTLATFLTLNRIGIIVSGATAMVKSDDMDSITWKNYTYGNEQLSPRDSDEPFTLWQGGRGRASSGKQWGHDVLHRYANADVVTLTELGMRQAFFEGYLKAKLRQSLGETYDVDGFIVGFSGKVLPLEIKEKSRTPKKGEFGVDAGRILMLLRLCLITDSNALYIIREVDESENRNLAGWVYMTVADLIMKCRWNLQGGGTGMGGGATQTIMTPGELFKPFTVENFSENWIAEHGSLQSSVRITGEHLINDLQGYISNGDKK